QLPKNVGLRSSAPTYTIQIDIKVLSESSGYLKVNNSVKEFWYGYPSEYRTGTKLLRNIA
ncbi:MAG: hypothetical protein ABFS45_23695, partial [Pseudomonadota bacterium]